VVENDEKCRRDATQIVAGIGKKRIWEKLAFINHLVELMVEKWLIEASKYLLVHGHQLPISASVWILSLRETREKEIRA
jgi:hypothetical protein